MVSPSWTRAGSSGGLDPFVSREGERSVVWLAGEQDLATVPLLIRTLAAVTARDHADLVVDLGEVSFVDARTLGVLIRGRRVLRDLSRDLTLRAPSRFARRVLELCGVADLLDPLVDHDQRPPGRP